MNNIQTKSQVVFSNRNKSQNSTFNHIFRTEVENNNSSSIINTHTQSSIYSLLYTLHSLSINYYTTLVGTVNLGKIRCTNLTGYDKLESLRQLKINRVNEVRKTTGSLQIETVDMSKQLNTSFDKDPYDKVQKPFIGDNAVAEFYTHYKNINRIKEENQIHQQEPSAYTAILDKSIQNNLFPSKMGLVKFQGDETKMNISNYQFGDKYIQVLGEGINRLPDIRNFNFNSNRISEIGAQAILQNMNKNVRVLDLSGNNIGKIGCQYLSNILDKRECRIEELNLENNKLGDNNIKTLLNSLNETNLSVKVLNLSRNFISDSSGEILKDFLKKNQYVTEFYLYWNVIKASGVL